MAPPPGAAPPPVPPVPVLLVAAVGAVGAVVVVDVMVIVADPIVSFGCCIKGKVLQLLASAVGVMRGVHCHWTSRCVLPELLMLRSAGAYRNVVSDSLLSSEVDSSAVGLSGWVSSTMSDA